MAKNKFKKVLIKEHLLGWLILIIGMGCLCGCIFPHQSQKEKDIRKRLNFELEEFLKEPPILNKEEIEKLLRE